MAAPPPVLVPGQMKAPDSARAEMPVEYETAIKALEACATLDETRTWRTAAEALAVWAKLYKSEEAELKAKRLRLYAYRRMGELATELRPSGRIQQKGPGVRGCRGSLPGAVSLLEEHGLTKTEAGAATWMARLPYTEFQNLLERPLSPTTLSQHLWNRDPVWMRFSRSAMALRGVLRRHPAREIQEVARMLGDRQIGTLRVLLGDLRRLLRDFDESSEP
jgi:hypothetical protein